MNPFGIAKHLEYFCPRVSEINQINTAVKENSSLWMHGDRLSGKTSLLQRFQIDNQNSYNIIYLDMYKCLDLDGFLLYLSDTIISTLFPLQSKELQQNLTEISEYFGAILDVGFKMDSSGKFNYTIEYKGNEVDKAVEKIWSIIHKWHEKNNKNKLVIIIDETPRLIELAPFLLPSIKNFINQKNSTYIFSGANIKKMEDCFASLKGALAESCKGLPLEPISVESWKNFIYQRFEEASQVQAVSRPGNAIDIAIEMSRQNPYYLQLFMKEIWKIAVEDKKIEILNNNPTHFFSHLVEKEESNFKMLIDGMTENQQNTLFLLAKTKGKNIYKKEFLEGFKLTKSGVERCLSSFVERNIITKEPKKDIYFNNPLFSYWLNTLQ